jgi:hypothetical protein
MFLSSLRQNNTITPPVIVPTATVPTITVSTVQQFVLGSTNPLAINYNKFATVDDGSSVFEENNISTNEVSFLILIGHSEIAGKGYTNSPGAPTAGDFMQTADKISNDMQFASGNSSFGLYNPSTLGFDHGREAYLNLLWKNHLDSSNGEPLYVAKTVVVGAAPHSKFMIGGRYWDNSWNTQIRPKINQLVALGKRVSIHFIFDMWSDNSLYGNNEMFDVYHSHWCIARALGIKEINANLTTYVNDSNWYQFMNTSYENYVAVDPIRRSVANARGLATVDGVHKSSLSLKNVAQKHLNSIQNQPKMKINWNIPIIQGLTMAFKIVPEQRAKNFVVSWDIPCETRVFTDIEKLHEKSISNFEVDVRLFRKGFVTLIGDLTGITRFQAPYTGTCVEFELVDKYVATLNYIDLRGNALIAGNSGFVVDYSNDYNVMKLAQGTVSNGTLLIKDSINGLTISARPHYITLINRGWTIDVLQP